MRDSNPSKPDPHSRSSSNSPAPDLTSEIRWFGRVAPPVPPDLSSHASPELRTDYYLLPTAATCGIKLRGGRLETKLQVSPDLPLPDATLPGTAADWLKWSIRWPGEVRPTPEAPAFPGQWIAVEKQRWISPLAWDHQTHTLRKTTELAEGPRVDFELARVTVGTDEWWTMCWEARGQPLLRRQLLESGLRLLAAERGSAVPLCEEDFASYPVWLRRHYQHP